MKFLSNDNIIAIHRPKSINVKCNTKNNHAEMTVVNIIIMFASYFLILFHI